jgi:hypothetical protein
MIGCLPKISQLLFCSYLSPDLTIWISVKVINQYICIYQNNKILIVIGSTADFDQWIMEEKSESDLPFGLAMVDMQ